MKDMPIKRRKPLLGPNPDWAKAFYCDPPSHDFLVFLVIAELMRRHHGAPPPLKVRFGLNEDQLGLFEYGAKGVLARWVSSCGVSREYYETMLEGVLRPAIEMIGAVEEPPVNVHMPFLTREIGDYCEYDYHIGDLVDAARRGYAIPQFTTPKWAHDEVRQFLHGSKPVVITLRETVAQPERNSQVGEWLKFAESIHDRYHVIFVRDTARASEGLSGVHPFAPFEICPRASTNVYFRAALYQQAYCNLMVSNGPIGWCQFSDAPFLCFKQLVPALPEWTHGHAHGWRKQAHMEVGDQYPWSSPLQRLTWTDDSFENIALAFDRFEKGGDAL